MDREGGFESSRHGGHQGQEAGRLIAQVSGLGDCGSRWKERVQSRGSGTWMGWEMMYEILVMWSKVPKGWVMKMLCKQLDLRLWPSGDMYELKIQIGGVASTLERGWLPPSNKIPSEERDVSAWGWARRTGVLKAWAEAWAAWKGGTWKTTVLACTSHCLCGQSTSLTHGHLKFSRSKAELLLLPALPPTLFSLWSRNYPFSKPDSQSRLWVLESSRLSFLLRPAHISMPPSLA